MKKYKTVVFDIDNTLTLLEPLLDLIAFCFKREQVAESEVTHFSIARAFDLTKEEEDLFWKENEEFMYSGAQPAVERINHIMSTYLEEDAIIHIVTARGEEHAEVTRKWFRLYGIPYTSILCIGNASKVALLESLGAEAVFEDKPDFFFELWDEGLYPVVDTFCIDYPYNQHVPCKYRLDRHLGSVMENREVLSDDYSS